MIKNFYKSSKKYQYVKKVLNDLKIYLIYFKKGHNFQNKKYFHKDKIKEIIVTQRDK